MWGARIETGTPPHLTQTTIAGGRVILRRTRPAPDELDAARTAVDICPARALALQDN